MEVHAVGRKVALLCNDKINVTENTRTGIPACVGTAVSYKYLYLIFAVVELSCQVNLKSAVTVLVFACGFAVYINGAIHINALKIKAYALIAYLTEIIFLHITSERSFVKILCIADKPVMRNVNRLIICVPIVFKAVVRFCLCKAPVVIKKRLHILSIYLNTEREVYPLLRHIHCYTPF